MDDALMLFSAPVVEWFRRTLGEPTPPQAAGWPAIARGDHTLIVAPTGSGKTLTAFLGSLDRLFSELKANPEPLRPRARDSAYRPGIRVVYVSPLKALNNDVERNLQAPLEGIIAVARERDDVLPVVRVSVRTGDTPANERAKMLRRPPQVLITTPESLYLMLTSERARQLFATTTTVILDEIHTLVGTKRGAHLAISLERLVRLAEGPVQRVGLSATIQPLDVAARFLGGQDPRAGHAPRTVTIVDASYRKNLDVRVVSAVESAPGGMPLAQIGSVWPSIVARVARLIDEHHTTLIFCNNRRLAERTADRLNEHRLRAALGDDAPPDVGPGDRGIFAAGADRSTLREAGLEAIRAHHGSMSKVARLEMEGELKSGRLPALVCTSSLELGIDVGDVDLVVQLQSPKSVASGLQRVGRSGHRVGETSVGRIFPSHGEDLLEAAAVCRSMRRGEIEAVEPPDDPLDVLAQQLVAMVAVEDWAYPDALALVRGAYPYRDLGEGPFRAVVEMLSGRYPESVSRHLKARLSWDRAADRLSALPGSAFLAVGSGGTIPDRGTYSLVLADRRTRVGELDEEFVFETRPGDTFLLGSQVWRAIEISEDRVVAEPAPGEVPRMPFWRGDAPWRPYDLGKRVGAFRRELAARIGMLSSADRAELDELSNDDVEAVARAGTADGVTRLTPAAREVLSFLVGESGLDREAMVQLIGSISRQLDVSEELASDQTIVLETFADAIGEPRLVVHSPFGGRVNGPWAIALAGAMRERLQIESQIVTGDDGFLLRFASVEAAPPLDLVAGLTSAEARERLLAELPGSASFGAQFRMNAARALLLPRERGGKRTPLWLLRLRSKDLLQAVARFDDFPIILETYRDCLRDVMDLRGLTEVLDQIHSGTIRVVVREAEAPSPTALALDYRLAMQYVYEYDAPRGERQLSVLAVNRTLLAELLRDGTLAELLRPEAISDVTARFRLGTSRARGIEELAQVLFERGDLSDDEVSALGSDALTDLAVLMGQRRVERREFGSAPRWVHRERWAEYEALPARPGPVLLRFLAHSGPVSLDELAARYGLDPAEARKALEELDSEVAVGRFGQEQGEAWVHRTVLEAIHRRSLAILRQEVRPVPPRAYAELVRRWQRAEAAARRDADGEAAAEVELARALQQLRGLPVSGLAWERDVLPARVGGFSSTDLAERCSSGELTWVVEGGRDPRRARVLYVFRGEGGIFLPRQPPGERLDGLGPDARAAYHFLRDEGAALLADVVEATGFSREKAQAAIVEAVLAGLVTNDSLDALHAVLGFEPLAPAARRISVLESQLAALRPDVHRPTSRFQLRDARRRARAVVESREQRRRQPWVGRWSLVHRPTVLGKPLTQEERAFRQARQLLARWGVVTRAALERETDGIVWDPVFDALSSLEARGEVRRGYFVEGLPGIQFAQPDAVELLRAIGGEIARRMNLDRFPEVHPAEIAVLNAVDPAQLHGSDDYGGRLAFARLASTAVASYLGEPIATLDEGGLARALPDHPALVPALAALAAWWSQRSGDRVRVTRWNDEEVFESAGVPLLEGAGFVREYGGMRWVGERPSR